MINSTEEYGNCTANLKSFKSNVKLSGIRPSKLTGPVLARLGVNMLLNVIVISPKSYNI